ncbi:hypothetical protein ABIF37_005828 [Bradyrhizobium diazoefficiens]
MPTIANAAVRSVEVAGRVERNVLRSIVAGTSTSRRPVFAIFIDVIRIPAGRRYGSGLRAHILNCCDRDSTEGYRLLNSGGTTE